MHTPHNMLFQWHITERCNLRCAHCYQSSFAGDEPDYAGLLDILGQFKDLLNALRRQGHPNGPTGHVTVTGGEPFIRPDFMDLLQAFFDNRGLFTFAILTNGSLIDQTTASRLKDFKPSFVQVSLDGGQKTHDRIRGPGSFEKAVSAVRQLVRKGIRTFISFTAHKDNYLEFPAVADIARRLKVARVWADRLIPPVAGSPQTDDSNTPLTLTPHETLDFFRLMRQAKEKRNLTDWIRFRHTEVAMHRGLQFLAGGVPYRCTAGESLIAVLPHGDVYPCRRMPIKVGNVMETPLAKIYVESRLLRSFRDRDRISAGCRRCFFVNVCQGGLKCLSYALTGDPFTADPGCWLSEPRTAPLD
jgi:radical SAM protein with 4Fe4S-binding SPASM domain